MTTTPTPDEARRALQDVKHRRQQAANAAGWGKGWWYWAAAGVVVAATGVLFDFKGDELGDWTNIITLAVLALLVLSYTRWGSALIGRPVRPRNPGPVRWVVSIASALVIMAAALLLGSLRIPHVGSIIGVACGLLLALAGPWWQERVLSRRASRP
jgi:hypothetical protein